MKIDVYDAQGQVIRQADLPEAVFGAEVKEPLLHEVVRYQLAKHRQGTAHTKNRSAVRGGGKKPWRQKGTGRARAGSRRSPLEKNVMTSSLCCAPSPNLSQRERRRLLALLTRRGLRYSQLY